MLILDRLYTCQFWHAYRSSYCRISSDCLQRCLLGPGVVYRLVLCCELRCVWMGARHEAWLALLRSILANAHCLGRPTLDSKSCNHGLHSDSIHQVDIWGVKTVN